MLGLFTLGGAAAWEPRQGLLVLGLHLVGMLPVFFVIYGFWSGHNWARWLVMMTGAFVVIPVLFALPAASAYFDVPPALQAILVGEGFFAFYLLYWLWTPAARGYFRFWFGAEDGAA